MADQKNVMIVEDHPDNRRLVSKVLHRAGFRTVELDRAEGLNQLVRKEAPDLILMDLELPGKTGFQALSDLRGAEGIGRIPVIALTAYAMPEDKLRCIQAGFDGYMSKPLDIASLVELVNHHLELQGEQ